MRYNKNMEKFLDYFKPSYYNLQLRINRKHKVLSGIVIIDGDVHSEVVKLHAIDMQIKSIKYAPSQSSLYEPTKECDFTYDGEVIKIPVSAQIAPNFYRASMTKDYIHPEDYDTNVSFAIEFETSLNNNMQGCYLSSYEYQGEPQQIVATQFESHYAREAFPCIDEPAAKAVFDLQLEIQDFQPGDVVLSNMPCRSRWRETFSFERTPRMSTYLLAWVVGPLQSVSTTNRNGVRVSSYGALNQPLESLIFANQTAARALEYYDEKFGMSYPLAKLDQVALPDFEAGAMENWGLVTYRESCMLADTAASLETKKSVAITVTHELSHQWFGDLVTMKWWDDLWLNESFASVMEYYATDALYPEFNIWQDFFTGDCLAALRRDCLRGVQSVQQVVHDPAEIATLFDGAIVYAKGARLVLMLIRLMTPEKFYQGIRYYFDKYQYENTVGDDLWRALQLYADFDVKDFMYAWISQPGYPALRHNKSDEYSSWSQQRFFIDGSTDDSQWPLPEVKDDMSGHYLLDLGDDEFNQKLADFTDLQTEQKLRLLIDRMLLAKAGLVSSSSLLGLLPKFSHENSAAVWRILLSIIGDLKLFCPPESEVESHYRQYLAHNFQDLLSNIDLSMQTQDVNAIQVRDSLLSIVNYLEDEKILRPLANRYNDDLSTLDSELRIYIMVAQIHFDEDATFAKLFATYPQISDPEIKSDILYCLALAKHPDNLSKLIDLLNQPEIVRPQDHIFLYIYLLRNYRTREKVLDWLISHWDYVKTLTGEKSIEDYPRYVAGVLRTKDEAQKFYDFFDPLASNPILKRTIEIAHTEIDSRLALIKSQSADVAEKLQLLINQKGV